MSQNAHYPSPAFDEFYGKRDGDFTSSVENNSQMVQGTGFANQVIMSSNSTNENGAALQMSQCVVGESTDGGIYDSAGRTQKTLPPSAEVW